MNDFEISPDELKRLRAEGERRLHEALSRAAEPANPEGGDSLPRRLPRMTPPSFEPRWYLLKSTGAKQGPFLAAELIAQFPLPTDRVRGTSESAWVTWELAGSHYPELARTLRAMISGSTGNQPPSPLPTVATAPPTPVGGSILAGFLKFVAVSAVVAGLFLAWLIFGGRSDSRAAREAQREHQEQLRLQLEMRAERDRSRQLRAELDGVNREILELRTNPPELAKFPPLQRLLASEKLATLERQAASLEAALRNP